MLADQHARLAEWLTPCPAERMRVFDRHGICVGRVKSVRRDADGSPQSILVTSDRHILGHTRECELAPSRCRVRGDAVHTSWALADLEAAPAR